MMGKLCPPSDPCFCFVKPKGKKPTPCGQPTPCPKPPCPDNGGIKCCLEVCDYIVKPTDAVGPCGQVGYINVEDLGIEGNCCEGKINLKVIDFDKSFFVTASITADKTKVKWTTQGAEILHKFGKIKMEACCAIPSGVVLTKTFDIIIGVKDLCQCPECTDCEHCDPCTGKCEDSDVEIVIGTGGSSSSLKVNA